MSKLDLGRYLNNIKRYTELRVQKNKDMRIVLLNGNLTSNTASSDSGVSARVYDGGSWGFASGSGIDDGLIREVLSSALFNAEFLSKKSKTDMYGLSLVKAYSDNDFATKKPLKPHKEKIEFIKNIDGYIIKKYPDLKSRSVIVVSLEIEKEAAFRYGSYFYSNFSRVFLVVKLITEKDGKPVDLHEICGGLGQFEDYFDRPEDCYGMVDALYEELIKKREGIYPEAGVRECIIASSVAGILAHEAVGHTTEADLVLSGSIAAEYMNKEVASCLVSLTDYANSAFGKICPIPVFTDDEGTKAEDVVIIENGILRNYMHNKESAARLNAKPAGNARAFRFSDEPLIRMRNTAILPGRDTLQDMIASIDDGYYLLKAGNGQADSTGEFMFSINSGYEIKKGKLGRALMDTSISGVAFDLLKTVTMVSSDFQWDSSGFCGKKQPMPVAMGGPAVKCRVNVGGK